MGGAPATKQFFCLNRHDDTADIIAVKNFRTIPVRRATKSFSTNLPGELPALDASGKHCFLPLNRKHLFPVTEKEQAGSTGGKRDSRVKEAPEFMGSSRVRIEATLERNERVFRI